VFVSTAPKEERSVRGLNRNSNHDLKNLFKGAADAASSKSGPFEQFYAALVAKGMRPEMRQLTLARARPGAELLARQVKTRPAQTLGLRSKKNCGRGSGVFP